MEITLRSDPSALFQHQSVKSANAIPRQMRIPTKGIAHSALKTIRSSPRDAVEDIVEQVIVMGQESFEVQGNIISFPGRSRRPLTQDLREHATGPPSSSSPATASKLPSNLPPGLKQTFKTLFAVR